MENTPLKALVIIPTWNEAQSITVLLDRIFVLGAGYSVLVVDDNSTDGTSGQVKASQRSHPGLFLLSRPAKLGLGSAYRDGFRFACDKGFDAVVQMDADLAHDPGLIPGMVDRLRDNDVVIGSRYIKGGTIADFSLGRRLVSRWGNLLTKFLLRLPVDDATSGFRCFKRAALERIHVETTTSEGFVFQIETVRRAHAAGFKIAEFPISFVGRKFQHSKFSFGICWEALRKVLGWALGRA